MLSLSLLPLCWDYEHVPPCLALLLLLLFNRGCEESNSGSLFVQQEFECLAIGSGTTRKCGLVGVGVALLKEVCHSGVSFEVIYAQATPSVGHSLLSYLLIRMQSP